MMSFIVNITFETEDTIESNLACMEQELDEILDSIYGITKTQILEIGKLFQDYKQAITKGVKKDIENNLEYETDNNIKSIADDDEFYKESKNTHSFKCEINCQKE